VAETQHDIKLFEREPTTHRGVAEGHRLGVVEHPCQVNDRTSNAGHLERIDLADFKL
jgi:hypothetical protein